MLLHGKQIIGGAVSAESGRTFFGINPATNEATTPPINEASTAEIDRALRLADESFDEYRRLGADRIAAFLEAIAQAWLDLGDDLIAQAHAETALPPARLTGERMRMVNQTRLFAALVREGSWVDARIDRADPARQPQAKPDIRRMLAPIGPVGVFGASNFPLAISVGGSDTVAALAAGCPVVAKAHPSHPGTCELTAGAIVAAAKMTGVPPGVFSMLQGKTNETGLALVRHPLTRAVAFTGSFAGGRALFDAAAARPEPIPIYAEMGSTNPVFVMPGAMSERGPQIARDYVQSVTLGTGQFCTNPGLLFAVNGPDTKVFIETIAAQAASVVPTSMLNLGISRAYSEDLERLRSTPGVRIIAHSGAAPDGAKAEAQCVIFAANLETLDARPELWEEVFGPVSLVVDCNSVSDLERVARGLRGHLTASIHGTPGDLAGSGELVKALERKVGRIVFNGFPTGIEVCAAMHHGGPYPATTDSHFTSIGTASIDRFVRPVCYQSSPQEALPIELRNRNERSIWRLVDGCRTRDDC